MVNISFSSSRSFVWVLMSAMGVSALRGPLGFVPSGIQCFSRRMAHPSNFCINPVFQNSGRFLSLKTSVEKPVRSMDRNSRRKQLTMQQSPDSVGEVDDEATYQNAIKNTGLAVSAAVAFGIGIGVVLGVPKAIEFFSL